MTRHTRQDFGKSIVVACARAAVLVALVACGLPLIPALAAFALFVALSLAAAYPLARFDEWWVRKLREIGVFVGARVRAA